MVHIFAVCGKGANNKTRVTHELIAEDSSKIQLFCNPAYNTEEYDTEFQDKEIQPPWDNDGGVHDSMVDDATQGTQSPLGDCIDVFNLPPIPDSDATQKNATHTMKLVMDEDEDSDDHDDYYDNDESKSLLGKN